MRLGMKWEDLPKNIPEKNLRIEQHKKMIDSGD